MNSKKQVREMAAALKISVYVILKKGGLAATVHFHHGAGRCMCDVWDGYALTWQGSSSGYGYDLQTAALSGAVIQGIRITDHCAEQKKLPKGMSVFPRALKAPKGFKFANYTSEEQGWRSCYRISGLGILEEYGFTVHQVI